MPRHRAPARSVALDHLRRLKHDGAESPVLDARIQFSELEGLARYARAMVTQDRVYPHLHPLAQASGRWSTTDPPLVNFPAKESSLHPVAWGMIVPDPGWYFLHYDMSALHARIAAAYTGDQDDLTASRNGYDLHTVTACRMFHWEFVPPDSVSGATPPWEGEGDRRRHLAKVMRYALLLGKNEMAALEAKEVEKLGLTRDEVLRFARLYLQSKPGMMAAKKRIWDLCIRQGKARSFMGRLRRLTFDPRNKTSIDDAMKEGWSHILQGSEQDIMQTIMADIVVAYPDTILTLNAHDGHTWAFQQSVHPWQETVAALRPIVERTWRINGEDVPIPAKWDIIWPDGTLQKVTSV